MSGPKNQEQILQGVTYRGVYDLQESRINCVVPSNQVLRKLNPFQKEDLMSGIIETKLEALSMQNEGKTFRIAVDAKKNSKGRGRVLGGDVDLFGFEQTSLAEKKTDFQDDMSC